MKKVTTKFKSGVLHEKHVVADNGDNDEISSEEWELLGVHLLFTKFIWARGGICSSYNVTTFT